MERDLNCEIIRDLLPLYVDGMVSDVSRKSIESHLGRCTQCREAYHDMAYEMEPEPEESEVVNVKTFLKKTKRMYFLYGLCGLSFIAMLVCMIVDLVLNKGITWSLIVTVSVLFADALVYAFLICRQKKWMKIMTVISTGTFILLCSIQITTCCLIGTGTLWIFRYGLPLLLLWLGIIWIPVLTGSFLNWNIWNCAALFLFLVITGNYATRLITGEFVWNDVFHMRGFTGNALGEIIGALLFIIIGRVKK